MKTMITLLFVLMAVGVSLGVYGQEQSKRVSKKLKGPWDLLIPAHDTVIMQGEEIKIGAYLKEKVMPEIEILGFGKSKKSDIEKGYYVIKQKPKKTTTYELVWYYAAKGFRNISPITVYVAKSEEERKQMEAKTEEKKKQEAITRSFMVYRPK